MSMPGSAAERGQFICRIDTPEMLAIMLSSRCCGLLVRVDGSALFGIAPRTKRTGTDGIQPIYDLTTSSDGGDMIKPSTTAFATSSTVVNGI